MFEYVYVMDDTAAIVTECDLECAGRSLLGRRDYQANRALANGCQSRFGVRRAFCWGYNGNPDRPTFTPSILVRGEELPEPVPLVCHSFVRDGRIQFLSDCTHALAGQTVEIPAWDDAPR